MLTSKNARQPPNQLTTTLVLSKSQYVHQFDGNCCSTNEIHLGHLIKVDKLQAGIYCHNGRGGDLVVYNARVGTLALESLGSTAMPWWQVWSNFTWYKWDNNGMDGTWRWLCTFYCASVDLLLVCVISLPRDKKNFLGETSKHLGEKPQNHYLGHGKSEFIK
jgi:hypothetical protein